MERWNEYNIMRVVKTLPACYVEASHHLLLMFPDTDSSNSEIKKKICLNCSNNHGLCLSNTVLSKHEELANIHKVLVRSSRLQTKG